MAWTLPIDGVDPATATVDDCTIQGGKPALKCVRCGKTELSPSVPPEGRMKQYIRQLLNKFQYRHGDGRCVAIQSAAQDDAAAGPPPPGERERPGYTVALAAVSMPRPHIRLMNQSLTLKSEMNTTFNEYHPRRISLL